MTKKKPTTRAKPHATPAPPVPAPPDEVYDFVTDQTLPRAEYDQVVAARVQKERRWCEAQETQRQTDAAQRAAREARTAEAYARALRNAEAWANRPWYQKAWDWCWS